MTTREVRQKYIKFMIERGHTEIPSASLVPEGDPTTLFIGSGMQPLLPYFLAGPHPQGTRIVDSQKCVRTIDIDEVGDNRHLTLYEMIGNWSFGDYFKEEQLPWIWSYMVDELGLNPKNLYATVFSGYEDIPKDTEAVGVLKGIFRGYGIEAKVVENSAEKGMQGGKIFYYDEKKNWWSRHGVPDNMPAGEPGGPTSEIFYDFGKGLGMHENSKFADKVCHVNCDCGRFVELGNSVFMTYKKAEDGGFVELENKNIDFGGGLERIVAATINEPDVYRGDSFWPMIESLKKFTGGNYSKKTERRLMRIIADHLKAVTFMVVDGVNPSNKGRGYVLRRLIRRSATKYYVLTDDAAPKEEFKKLIEQVIDHYGGRYFNPVKDKERVFEVITIELDKLSKALDRGLKEIEKANLSIIDGKFAFDLYQSYGLPFEVTQEVLKKHGRSVSKEAFKEAFERHKGESRQAAEKKFKGGLADHSDQVVKYHTTTHLLHKALRELLGEQVVQRGSNITGDRLRFDFNYSDKLTVGQISQVEELVNKAIEKGYPVGHVEMSTKEAKQTGAVHAFGEKYGDRVKVYYIGESLEKAYSKEFCGGPHVKNTAELDPIEIYKQKSVGKGVRRVYARKKSA